MDTDLQIDNKMSDENVLDTLCKDLDKIKELVNTIEKSVNAAKLAADKKEATNNLASSVKDYFSNLTDEVQTVYQRIEKFDKIGHEISDAVEENGVKEEIVENGEKDPLETDENSDEEQPQSESTPNKPLIKLVDINKLVDSKKPKKSVSFDSSVIILTSSDEEGCPESAKKATVISLNDSEVRNKKKEYSSEKSNKKAEESKKESESDEEASPEKVETSKKTPKGKLRPKKRDNLHENNVSDLSLDSDSSSNEDDAGKVPKRRCLKKKPLPEENVAKDLSIPLYRYDPEKMKHLYETKKDCLEVKRLTNMKSLKRKRHSNGKNGDKPSSPPPPVASTSSSEEKQNKKSKNKSPPDTSIDSDHTLVDEIEATPDKSADLFSTDDDQDMPMENADASEENSKESENVAAQLITDGIKDQSDEDKEKDEEMEANSDSDDSLKKKTKVKGKKNKKKEEEKEKEKEEEKDKEKEEEKEKSSDQEINSEKENSDKDDDEEDKKGKKDKKWRKDKLLTEKLPSSSDSDAEDERIVRFVKKKLDKEEASKSDAEPSFERKKRTRRQKKKKTVISDSDSDKEKSNDSGEEFAPKSGSGSSSESHKSESEKEEETKPEKKKRKRIKRTKESSSDDDDKSTRKQIRKVIDRDSLAETTKKAEAEEKERKARISEKQKRYNQIFEAQLSSASVDKVVLDFDEETKKELLTVDKHIAKQLKPHQVSGVKFMWDACFESLERAKSTKGSGCILAHCMGLGKTLQVVTLSHTLIMNTKKTGVSRVMIVCPLNTVLNWVAEFKKWMPDEDDLEVYELVSWKQNSERSYQVQSWIKTGGILIVGYNMFRMLSNPDNKRIPARFRKVFKEGLVDPGPDLVVCDEGHLLKNEKTSLSVAMNRIKTIRRIVLTGTPLQNNLREYWCMVQFIKPNLLGTYKEYLNRFVNPITNGQYTDSTQHDIQIMRRRSHVLHKLLDGVVQRRDYAVLAPYLPPKHEYVLFLKLTDVQIKMYEHYMENFARRTQPGSKNVSFLFVDFQALQRICTHPRVLFDRSKEGKKERFFDEDAEDSEGSLKDFIDDGSSDASTPSSGSDNNSGDDVPARPAKTRLTRAQAAAKRDGGEDSDLEIIDEPVAKEWWQSFCDGNELDNINNSSKLYLLFEILKECEQIGDKILIFSQSLYTLNCIEYFLNKIDEATQNGTPETVGGYTGTWTPYVDYFRLDGSSSCDNRAAWCKTFNDPANTRARLFLISTRAGGLGINLVAANRVIIFDVSWNPSNDVQSIYRVYRFGQTKPSYIYRFVAYGTMEMKIYERQVTKQAISKRVIDEQQIDRHYNSNDLQELYKCDLNPEERPIPLVPKDVLLGEMLQKHDKVLYKYHEHQSLLENKEEETLNEEERKAAWEEFENEKITRTNTWSTGLSQYGLSNAMVGASLYNIVKRDNPTWSEVQIRGIIPAMVQQLQMQITEGELTLYHKVQDETRRIQAERQKQQYQYQQMMRLVQQQQQLLQQQQQAYSQMGDLRFNDSDIARMLSMSMREGPALPAGNSSRRPGRPTIHNSNEIIELND